MIKCEICQREFKTIQGLSSHITRIHHISTKNYYLEYINKTIGMCEICNNLTTFRNIRDGFSRTCSNKCAQSCEDVKEKIRETTRKRYGCDNASQSEVIKQKKKDTSQKNYGVSFPTQSPSIKNKISKTNMEKYGNKCSAQGKDVQEKIRKASLKKFGTSYPFHSDEAKQKRAETNLCKYGVEYPFQSEEIQNKVKTETKKHYGEDCIFKIPELHKITIDTHLKNRYNILLTSEKFSELTPLFSEDEYLGVDGSFKYKWKCKKCGKEFIDNLDDGRVPRCTNCYPRWENANPRSSKEECLLYDFIKSLGVIAIHGNRSILKGKEIDIYIPYHKIAIEFNGCFWHTESQGKYEQYHLSKTLGCKEKGIQLIHIFEDEWKNKQNIVKSIIKSAMGLCNNIDSQDCIVRCVAQIDAMEFLNNNHIYGKIDGKHYGLYFASRLIFMITIDLVTSEILRVCNQLGINVVGGLSSILGYLETMQIVHGKIIVYKDRRFGEGNDYLKNRLILSDVTSPSFYYVQLGTIKRYNKCGSQHLLESKLETFDPNLTEWQNMQLNGYDRIWDCGCNVYTFQTV